MTQRKRGIPKGTKHGTASLPDHQLQADLAKQLGTSERALVRIRQRTGYVRIGRKAYFNAEHQAAILKALEVHPQRRGRYA